MAAEHKGAPWRLAWEAPEATYARSSAPTPSNRTYFTMVPHGGRLWVFGGFGDQKQRYRDLHCYDTAERRWLRVDQQGGPAPGPTYLHSAVVHASSMYVFGGNDGKDSDQFCEFALDEQRWRPVSGAPPVAGAAARVFGTPSPRYGHAAAVIDGCMVVVGGCRKNSTYLRDTHEYNFSTGAWRRLGDMTMSLAYHSLFVHAGRVYLFGGYDGERYVQELHALNRGTSRWEPVVTTGDRPEPRCGAAACVVGGQLMVLGGYTASGHNQVLYQLDLASMAWRRVQDSGQRPIARAYLQAAQVSGTLYAFGGYNGSHCIGDFRSLPLRAPLPDLGNAISSHSPDEFVGVAFSHFAAAAEGGSMTRAEVRALIEALQGALAPRLRAAAEHPFPLTIVPQATQLGFSRDRVIACMTAIHASGRDPTRFDLLVDELVSMPEESSAGAGAAAAVDGPPDLERNASTERLREMVAKLKVERDHIMTERDDVMQCKMCFEQTINCTLRNCGHCAVCHDCADQLLKAKKPCPICRKPITGKLDVFF